jgi:hypothetical protein
MTYVRCFGLRQAGDRQISEMKNSIIDRRKSKQGSVPAQVGVADEIQADSRILMETKAVRTTQKDVGKSFRLRTTKGAVIGSYGRATNIDYTNDVREMRAVENMDSKQILTQFLRDDIRGKVRVCLTGSIHGLLAVSSKIDEDYPLLVDLIASYDREQGTTNRQDFDESRGSVDIGPSIEVARKKMTHILNNYTTLFLDGQEVFTEFLKHIRDFGKYIAQEMSDSDMQEIDPKFESYRHDHGTGSYAHVLLIRNEETGDTILVYAVWQMASCIGSVSMNILLLTS